MRIYPSNLRFLATCAACVAFACGGTDEATPSNSAGSGGDAGGAHTGSGGKMSAGGVTTTGGSTATGGVTATGGSTAAGGTTGGTTSTGGTAGSDGGMTTGGTTSTGGAPSTGGTTSSGGATSTGGTTATGGALNDGGSLDGGNGCVAGPPSIAHVGTGGQLLLRGTVVTPLQVFAGEVLIVGDTITCVAASCAGATGASTATRVDTNGIIFPGLVNTNDRVLFDAFDETDWAPSQAYTNSSQYTADPRYGALVDAKQYLNGEGVPSVDLGCELDKYAELKGLVAGTTSVAGFATTANRPCYGSLARTVDQTPNGLGADKIQVAALFPTTTAADQVCNNFQSGATDAYLIGIAQGTDAAALADFSKLNTVTTTDGCLFSPKTSIIGGTALGDPELSTMATNGMSLVWTPHTDVTLYAAGQTANVPLALGKGINVALATDWSLTGNQNLLDALRYADSIDDARWGNQLSSAELVRMVTTNAAKALGLGSVLGSLAPGMKADVMVIGGDSCAPYDALLAARPDDVRLVLVGGVPLYGDPALNGIAPASPACESLAVCGKTQFACVARTSSSATDKLGQTFVEIQKALSDGLIAYDAMNLSQWDFAPLAPLVKCP